MQGPTLPLYRVVCSQTAIIQKNNKTASVKMSRKEIQREWDCGGEEEKRLHVSDVG